MKFSKKIPASLDPHLNLHIESFNFTDYLFTQTLPPPNVFVFSRFWRHARVARFMQLRDKKATVKNVGLKRKAPEPDTTIVQKPINKRRSITIMTESKPEEFK